MTSPRQTKSRRIFGGFFCINANYDLHFKVFSLRDGAFQETALQAVDLCDRQSGFKIEAARGVHIARHGNAKFVVAAYRAKCAFDTEACGEGARAECFDGVSLAVEDRSQGV